jgi:DHA1 family bicyclomycin/chloramphenicol resistance-like MFS transporter
VKLGLLLGLLGAMGPLAIDLYLPAFPTLAQELALRRRGAAEPGELSSSRWQWATGIRRARRPLRPPPALFGGLALFALASIGCAAAPDITG